MFSDKRIFILSLISYGDGLVRHMHSIWVSNWTIMKSWASCHSGFLCRCFYSCCRSGSHRLNSIIRLRGLGRGEPMLIIEDCLRLILFLISMSQCRLILNNWFRLWVVSVTICWLKSKTTGQPFVGFERVNSLAWSTLASIGVPKLGRLVNITVILPSLLATAGELFKPFILSSWRCSVVTSFGPFTLELTSQWVDTGTFSARITFVMIVALPSLVVI